MMKMDYSPYVWFVLVGVLGGAFLGVLLRIADRLERIATALAK